MTVSAEASSRAARRAKLSDGDDGGDDDSEHHDEPDIAEDVGDDDDMGNTTTEQEDGGDDTDVELVEEAYRTTKAMGDADRQFLSERQKITRTADIRTIFKLDKNRMNPDTGKIEEGNWCTVCRSAGVAKKNCFFTGSISTLRTHIARNADHVKIYMARCKELNVTTNHRALAKSASVTTIDGVQGSLDGIVIRQPRPPTFSTAGLLDYIIELIVEEDEAFRLVDNGAFRRLLMYTRPSLSEKDIPHRTKVHKEILLRARAAEVKVREALADIEGKVSFTFDTWTSNAQDPYLSVTGHYITAPKDHPHDWKLKSEQLAFTHFEGNHSGVNMANVLVRTVDRYDLRDKVGWFTADNASNNGVCLRELKMLLQDPLFDAKQRYIRCMEHSVDLSAKTFVQAVAPSSSRKILKKMKKALQVVSDDDSGTFDLDDIDARLANFNFGDDNDEEIEGEDDEEDEALEAEVDTAAAVGKALLLVKQIRASPQARAFFKKSCQQVEVPVLQLLLWIRTRWASLFTFLDRLLILKKGVNHFVQLADDSDEVPNLKGKAYSDFRLRKQDWARMELMHEVLQEPATAKQTFSSAREPTVWRTIPVLEFLLQSWENMADLPKFSEVEDAIRKGLENIDKWYRKVNDTDAYFICLALDPNIKTAYAEDKWQEEFYDAGLRRLEEVFDSYYVTPPASVAQDTESTSSSVKAQGQYGYAWMRNAVRSRQATERGRFDPRDELRRYLESPLAEGVTDVVGYWGRQAAEYPTLSRMARDYLAIQGSATPSERAFSGGGITGTPNRNRLSVASFEALQLLKSAYRNGHITAADDAAKHLNPFFDVSEVNSDGCGSDM